MSGATDRMAVAAEVAMTEPCVYCGDPATTNDHVVPRAYGGTDDPSNLVPACGPCNSRKHTLPAELVGVDWRAIATWLQARGWRPIGSRQGRTSTWQSPDPTDATMYSRASAIRHAAWNPRWRRAA